MITHNNWIDSNIDDILVEKENNFKLEVTFSPYKFEPSSYKDACDEAAHIIADIGKSIYVGLSGGADSEYVCRIFKRNNIDFKILIVNHRGNKEEFPYAMSVCKELNIEPIILELEELDQLRLYIDLVHKKLNGMSVLCIIRYIACQYAIENNGVYVTGNDFTITHDQIINRKRVEAGNILLGAPLYDWIMPLLIKPDVEIPFYCHTPKIVYEATKLVDLTKSSADAKYILYDIYRPKIYPRYSDMFHKIYKKYEGSRINPIIDYIEFGDKTKFLECLLDYKNSHKYSQ